MSARTADGRSAATYWISIIVGLVILGILVVFVVVLPKLDDDSDAGGDVSLPEKLPGGWAAVDVPQPVDPAAPVPEGGQPQTQEDADRNAEMLAMERAYSDEVLSEVVDGTVTTRTYFDTANQQVLWVQYFGEELGSFVPTLVNSPEVRGLAKPPVELDRVDDATTCMTEWAEVPAGQTVDEDQARGGVTCQRSEGGHTLRVTGLGMDQDRTVEMLDTVEREIS